MQLTALFALALVSVTAAAPTQLTGRTTQNVYTIHPNGDTTKCVGVLGGALVVGAAADIFDCNGSATQKWYFTSGPRMTNPADGSEWALDVAPLGETNREVVNGRKAVLNKSADGGEDGSPYQSWGGPNAPSAPKIQLSISQPANGVMCLDLMDGIKANRSPLQIWQCAAGNTNQIWTYTVVGQITI
ncbi:ricin B lectin domain-containing protein [Mycena albidolilacea]|uniref:Ricin B lectin domain-containing protein n=1 Tax=Mycena albidolilacea TaxID=1033008 RepID=A0AAD6ZUK0_9AGAR|nr:ricin B lectin domain-containing protein [Mycena albidolilacea]